MNDMSKFFQLVNFMDYKKMIARIKELNLSIVNFNDSYITIVSNYEDDNCYIKINFETIERDEENMPKYINVINISIEQEY